MKKNFLVLLVGLLLLMGAEVKAQNAKNNDSSVTSHNIKYVYHVSEHGNDTVVEVNGAVLFRKNQDILEKIDLDIKEKYQIIEIVRMGNYGKEKESLFIICEGIDTKAKYARGYDMYTGKVY